MDSCAIWEKIALTIGKIALAVAHAISVPIARAFFPQIALESM